MTLDHISRLSALGFSWGEKSKDDDAAVIWAKQFLRVKEYKLQNGHCRISKTENPALYVWIKDQRRQYNLYKASGGGISKKKSTMTQDQINLLNSEEFEWVI